MQNAKDTFYIALRDRLAALNPARTTVIRGAVRPAVLVVENELVAGATPLDAFLLSWKDAAIDATEPLPLHTLLCEIAYATGGTREALGTDRGRVLDAMDQELRSILQPSSAVKQNFQTSPASPQGTQVFWSELQFGAAVVHEEEIARVTRVTVFALQEEGN